MSVHRIIIPEVILGSSINQKKMPVLGLGTGTHPFPEPETVIKVVLDAIEIGYRMFDTASNYQTEEPLGEAISQALNLGLIKSRDEVFITSKLGLVNNYANEVLPCLRKTLSNLKMEYVDQYLIHGPLAVAQDVVFPPSPGDLLPMDIKSVWKEMEECQTLGLTKSIGVSNFTCKKLGDLLAVATIPPSINQVEMNPAWQQRKLREFCKANGVILSIFCVLGAAGNFWGTTRVLESEVLKEIAESKGKTVAQVALRWAYEQGVVVLCKSFNKERLKQNFEIFDWSLSEDELKKIEEIPQERGFLGTYFLSETGPYKTLDELWDGEL